MGQRDWDLLVGPHCLPPWKASCSLHCSPAHGPPLCLSNLLPPQPGGGGTLPPVLSWWLGVAKVSSLRALPGPSKC